MRVSVAVAVAAVACLSVASRAAARGWERPVEGAVLRAFAVGADRFAAGQHRGVDLAAPPGAPVRAACDGRVSFAGRVPGGGRTVSVRCGRFVATHQQLGAIAVRRGRVVIAGARIGTVGRARPSPQVHLGVRDVSTGAYVDPLALLDGSAPAPLPPLGGARRAPPLGPAPPARRPLRVGPAPRELPVVRPLAVPVVAVERLPWPVWLGLALVGLGLPLGGGFVTLRRRRRAARAIAQTA